MYRLVDLKNMEIHAGKFIMNIDICFKIRLLTNHESLCLN